MVSLSTLTVVVITVNDALPANFIAPCWAIELETNAARANRSVKIFFIFYLIKCIFIGVQRYALFSTCEIPKNDDFH
jgi:hypothetical protein